MNGMAAAIQNGRVSSLPIMHSIMNPIQAMQKTNHARPSISLKGTIHHATP